MQIKVSEATNTQLDWLVSEVQGTNNGPLLTYEGNGRKWIVTEGGFTVDYATNWSQGGPIIERERIELLLSFEGHTRAILNRFDLTVKPTEQHGPTPLIAAMRCYVMSKLGDEVEVPDDLA